MQTDPTDGQPGLRLETAASAILRNFILDYMGKFALTIRRDRLVAQTVTTQYTNALAGACALAVAGGHGSRDEVYTAQCAKLREFMDRDLAHLGK